MYISMERIYLGIYFGRLRGWLRMFWATCIQWNRDKPSWLYVLPRQKWLNNNNELTKLIIDHDKLEQLVIEHDKLDYD